MEAALLELIQGLFGAETRIQTMSGGRSGAQLWEVNQNYVVRRAGARGQGSADMAREQACLAIAADQGLAPSLIYAQNGITVMQKVEGSPIGRLTPRQSDPLGRLAGLLRKLHSGPAFPEGPKLPEMMADLQTNLPDLPAILAERVGACWPRLEALGRPAPCHLDLNPSNILATPERIYLVDWEVACQNEPYLDLAQLGVWVCRDQAEREYLLESYLGHSPGREHLERMQLARVLALCFYASAFHLVARMQARAWVDQGPDLDRLYGQMARTGQPFQPEEMAHALMLELEQA